MTDHHEPAGSPVLRRARRPLWRGGPSVSALTLGTSSFGSRLSETSAQDAIARALAAAINCFDTSPLYGHGTSEGIVGHALAGRDDVVVITKFGRDVAGGGVAGGVARRGLDLRGMVRPLAQRSALVRRVGGKVFQRATTTGAFSADDARASIERSCERLGAVTTVVLFHSPTAEELRASDAPVLLRSLVADGTIAAFGVSVDDPETADIALGIEGVQVIELPCSTWDQRFVTSDVLARAEAAGIGILARSPFTAAAPGLEHTLPSPILPAEAAGSLRFVLAQPEVASVVCSLSTPEHLGTAIAVADGGGPPEPAETTRPVREAGTGTLANVTSYLRFSGLRQSATYSLYRVPIARELYRRRRVAHAGAQVPLPLDDSLFPGRLPVALAAEIRRDSYVAGLDLSPELVGELRELVDRSPLFVERDGRKVSAPNRDALVDLLGATPVIGHVDCADDPLVRRIGEDPVLQEVFRAYFGYPPGSIEPRVWWSYVTDAPEHERLSGHQTVLFHFDQHAMNFLYANFFLTDVDLDSGAHVLVRGSHRHKPLTFTYSSAYKRDEAIVEKYGTADLVTVEGPAGSGIIEDAWCYHKALVPTARDRLFLQFRYA